MEQEVPEEQVVPVGWLLLAEVVVYRGRQVWQAAMDWVWEEDLVVTPEGCRLYVFRATVPVQMDILQVAVVAVQEQAEPIMVLVVMVEAEDLQRLFM